MGGKIYNEKWNNATNRVKVKNFKDDKSTPYKTVFADLQTYNINKSHLDCGIRRTANGRFVF